jgi:hypothetical protein
VRARIGPAAPLGPLLGPFRGKAQLLQGTALVIDRNGVGLVRGGGLDRCLGLDGTLGLRGVLQALQRGLGLGGLGNQITEVRDGLIDNPLKRTNTPGQNKPYRTPV